MVIAGRTRLVVITPPELSTGFRLGGTATIAVNSTADAQQAVRTLVDEGERGVIAVYEPFFAGFDAEIRSRLEDSVAPVIVTLPSGTEADSEEVRRARLAALMQRAVGYHITFGEGEG